MPEWIKEIVLTIMGSASIAAGVGWYFKSKREDRIDERNRQEAEKKALKDNVEKLQSKVEALLMDAIAREKESNIQMTDRMQMDEKLHEILSAATTALKESAVALAGREKNDARS